jgi:hypothetical protein
MGELTGWIPAAASIGGTREDTGVALSWQLLDVADGTVLFASKGRLSAPAPAAASRPALPGQAGLDAHLGGGEERRNAPSLGDGHRTRDTEREWRTVDEESDGRRFLIDHFFLTS